MPNTDQQGCVHQKVTGQNHLHAATQVRDATSLDGSGLFGRAVRHAMPCTVRHRNIQTSCVRGWSSAACTAHGTTREAIGTPTNRRSAAPSKTRHLQAASSPTTLPWTRQWTEAFNLKASGSRRRTAGQPVTRGRKGNHTIHNRKGISKKSRKATVFKLSCACWIVPAFLERPHRQEPSLPCHRRKRVPRQQLPTQVRKKMHPRWRPLVRKTCCRVAAFEMKLARSPSPPQYIE